MEPIPFLFLQNFWHVSSLFTESPTASFLANSFGMDLSSPIYMTLCFASGRALPPAPSTSGRRKPRGFLLSVFSTVVRSGMYFGPLSSLQIICDHFSNEFG